MEELLKPYINKSISSIDTNILDDLKPLISDLTFFKNWAISFPNIEYIAYTTILTNLVFHQFVEDQFILKKDDKINGIYIIFTGEISIFNEGEEEKKKKEKKVVIQKYIRRKNIFNSIYDINLIPNSTLNPGEAIGINTNFPDINLSKKLIQATKNTILGYINYNLYYKIIKELKSIDSGQIVPFIRSLNLFANINNFIEKLKLYLIQRKYTKDSYIFQEGDKYKTLYIIKKGIVKISVKIKRKTKSLIQPELLMGNINKVKISGNKEHELKGFYIQNFDYNLINLCTGEMLGDIEFFEKYPFYIYSAKCITEVDIFEVNLEKFLDLAKKCGDNLNKFHDKIKTKIEFFKKRMENIKTTIKKVTRDTSKQDIYTQIFLNNNIQKYNEKNRKYINSPTTIGKIIPKFKCVKLNNNYNNVFHNYTSILKERNKCFSAKASNKDKKSFILQSYPKYKKLISTRKLLNRNNFNKIKYFFTKKKDNGNSNNISIKSFNQKRKSIFRNSKSSLESYEIEKINKDMDEISGLDEGKRNYFVNLFVENYRNEHNSREKILFNKKLKHKFLIENRRNSEKNSLFSLTTPKSNSFAFNHIY